MKKRVSNPPISGSSERISGPEGEVVAKCEEFTLYANGWLESSREVERALWRATLGISNRQGSDDRLNLALALLNLAEHQAEKVRARDQAAKQEPGHQNDLVEERIGRGIKQREADLLERLSDTLGKMLIPMLSTPDSNSARKKAGDAATGIKNAIASIKSATLEIARWKTSRPKHGSNHPGAIVWEMQLVAKDIFRETHHRPTKREIRWELEQEGWRIYTKDAPARWLERFRKAGFADLPDWAPPKDLSGSPAL